MFKFRSIQYRGYNHRQISSFGIIYLKDIQSLIIYGTYLTGVLIDRLIKVKMST